MKKTNAQPLKTIVQEYLKAMKLDTKLKEVRLIKQWEDVIGKTAARYTQNLYIKDRKLFVKVNSSIIRSELIMLKSGILQKLNENAGEKLIDDIVFR